MIHETLPVGLLQCNCSIFGDEQSREAIVIDPGDNIEDILAILDRHSLRVTGIVITHAHIDHIGGAAKLKAATGAPVAMNANDQDLYDHLDAQASWLGMEPPSRTEIDRTIRDGDTLTLGPAEFRVLHTPGHTQGSICSIEDKLMRLPEETIVVPGHGANTTIGREKERSPFLQGL